MAQFGGSVRPASELRRRARAVRFAGVAATAALALAGSLSLGATSAFASTTSTLSIIAGTGTSGAPTAGSATASTLGQPDAVAVDPSGDVFIADGSASVVEEVTPDDQLSIIAGTGAYGAPTLGPATSKMFTPSGL